MYYRESIPILLLSLPPADAATPKANVLYPVMAVCGGSVTLVGKGELSSLSFPFSNGSFQTCTSSVGGANLKKKGGRKTAKRRDRIWNKLAPSHPPGGAPVPPPSQFHSLPNYPHPSAAFPALAGTVDTGNSHGEEVVPKGPPMEHSGHFATKEVSFTVEMHSGYGPILERTGLCNNQLLW